jgi:hypothetical protein
MKLEVVSTSGGSRRVLSFPPAHRLGGDLREALTGESGLHWQLVRKCDCDGEKFTDGGRGMFLPTASWRPSRCVCASLALCYTKISPSQEGRMGDADGDCGACSVRLLQTVLLSTFIPTVKIIQRLK